MYHPSDHLSSPPIPQSVTKNRLFVYSSRKFHIPHHSHSLKWKRTGALYTVRSQSLPLAVRYPYLASSSSLRRVQCTCSSLKGPLATLEAAYLSAPPRLRVYSSLLRDDTARTQPNYGGVPHVLLDYLIATSLLLVTDIEEYLHRPSREVGAAKSAMEALLPPALRNRRNGRGPYVFIDSRSPTDSNDGVSSSNNYHDLTDDTRSFVSEVPSTPSSAISQQHPYSFFQLAALDPDIPPVPEVPPEHQAFVPSIPPSSATLPSLPSLGRNSTVRRRLPQPPGQPAPMNPSQAEQFWGLPSAHSTPDLVLSSDSPDSSMSIPASSQHSQHIRQMSELSGSSVSINRRQLPPQRQPPQLPIPIPPKLRDDLTRSMPPSATSSDGLLSSTSETSGQMSEPGSPIHEDDGTGGMESDHQEFHRRLSDINQFALQGSTYELPPPAYDAIDFSIPHPPVLGGEGYQSFSVNSRLPPEQIS